jgi:hypothetical protein
MRAWLLSAVFACSLLAGPTVSVSATDGWDHDSVWTSSLDISPKFLNMKYEASTEIADMTVSSELPDWYPVLDYYLTVDPASGFRSFFKLGSFDSIDFQIYDSDGPSRKVVMSSSEAVSAADVLTGVLSDKNKHRRASDKLYLFALPGEFAAAGTYYSIVTVNLWSGKFPGTRTESASILATLTVRDILGLSIVPPNAPYDYAATNAVFDFQELDPGDEYLADLVARANTTYKVLIRSQNGGELALENAGNGKGGSPEDTIGYAFYVDGRRIALSPKQDVPLTPFAQERTTKDGKRFRLKTKILDFGFPYAGTYSDILTLTIVKD